MTTVHTSLDDFSMLKEKEVLSIEEIDLIINNLQKKHVQSQVKANNQN